MLRHWCREDWRFDIAFPNTFRFALHPGFYIARAEYIGCLLIRLSANCLQTAHTHSEKIFWIRICQPRPRIYVQISTGEIFPEGEYMHYSANILWLSLSRNIHRRILFKCPATYTPDLQPSFLCISYCNLERNLRNGVPFPRWDETLISVAIFSLSSFHVLSFHYCLLAAHYWSWIILNMFFQWVNICLKAIFIHELGDLI